VSAIKEQIRSVFQGVVPGASPGLNYLGALGITTDNKGHLVVNAAKLAEVLEGRRPGVTVADVRTLFALSGTSSNPGIQFVTGSAKTKASGTPYVVNITQAAEAATLTAATALADSTVVDGTNNTFQITLDGKTSSTLTIADGTYSRSALAQAIQAAINSDSALNGATATVLLTADALTVRSNRLGAASQIVFQSGAALATFGFSAGAADQGQDVQGSFLVNGVLETATGSGQFLSGAAGNANTSGLQLNVLLTSAQVGAGIQVNINVIRGVASRLDAVLNSFLDPVNGRMKTINDSFQTTIDRLEKQKIRQNDFILARSASLQRQFQAMEEALGQLQAASNFINLQSNNLTNN
jgi:flagellar hook-associated protein 2